MCLCKAWYRGESAEKAVMEDIANMKIEEDKVILTSLFGEERVEKATVEEVDFTQNSIILGRR